MDKMIVVTDHGDQPNSVWWAKDLDVAQGWARMLLNLACGPVAIIEFDERDPAHLACARFSPQLNWR